MRAIVLRKPRQLEMVEVPRPALTAPEHVLIEVKACGICGSDLRYWAGENPWALHTLGRHVDNPRNMTLGHEFAGVVVSLCSESGWEHKPFARAASVICASRATRTSAAIRCTSGTPRDGERSTSTREPMLTTASRGRIYSIRWPTT